MSDFRYQDIASGLSDDELKAAALLLKYRKQEKANDPLTKYKENNDLHKIFGDLRTRYRIQLAGNKTGKTFRLGRDLVAMCKGRCEEFGINFPHKPPLKIWYCGRDRNVLSDEPLTSIKTFLKGESIDHRTIFTGQAIQRMYIWTDDGVQSEVWFKPYNGDIGIFESANVHAVFMDEEPPRDVFSAIKPKIAVMPGYVFIAMTPDRGMSWTHDLMNGSDPDHGNLKNKGYLGVVKGSVWDNVRNFKVAEGYKWVRYPEGYIGKKDYLDYEKRDDILYANVPDTFADYVDQYTYGSNEYRMRVLGDFVSFTGKVYPFDPAINVCALEDMPSFSNLKVFAGLDWGYRDEFCFFLCGIDKDNIKYIFDGVYQSYLDARDQAKLIKEKCDYWGIRPEMIVADIQICSSLPQKDSEKAHIQSIKDYYLDELGENFTNWRTEALDKKNAPQVRDAIVRDMKLGKLKFVDFENRSYPFVQEMQRLEYKEGNREVLKGKDHFDAALRYLFASGIKYDSWLTSDEVGDRNKVNPDYRSPDEPFY